MSSLHLVVFLLLSTFSPTLSTPVTMATVLPKDGFGSIWRAVQRIVATYPKEDVLNQLRKMQKEIDDEAYRQFMRRYPNALYVARPQPLF